MRKINTVLALVLCFALMLTGCGGGTASEGNGGLSDTEQTWVIKAADGFPEGHVFTTNALKGFFAGVEEATDGRVTFEHYPGGQLGKQADMLDLLTNGVADFAFIGPSYMSGKLPLCSAFELPGMYPDAVVAANSVLELAQTGILYDEEFSNFNVMPVLGIAYSPYDIWNNKHPIDSIDDLKGMTIRGAGISMELAVSTLGGVLVNIVPQEMYDATLRGTVDGLALSIESLDSYKVQEVVKYGSMGLHLTGWIGVYCFNDKTWNSFPDDIKQIIIEEGQKATMAGGTWIKEAGDAFKVQFEEEGVEINVLTPEQQAAFREALAPVEVEWLNSMKTTYRKENADEILDEVKATIEKWDSKLNK